MAANLATFADGRYRMAAWGRIPVWHGQGQRTDQLMTADEAMRLGGLDYEVETRPALFYGLDEVIRPGQGVQIVRTDTERSLGYASEHYSPIQNSAMMELIRPFLDSGEVHGIMTAGALGQGEKSWVQAVVGEFGVDSTDRGLATLLLLNSFDATRSLTVGFCSTYVVCGNTYAMAGREMAKVGGDKSIQVKHMGNVEQKLRLVQAALDVGRQVIRDHEALARELAGLDLADNLRRYSIAVLPPSDGAMKEAQKDRRMPAYWRNMWNGIEREYHAGPGSSLPSRRGTAFGAWNAVTGWADYRRSANLGADKRTDSGLFGGARDLKARALAVAVDHLRDGKPWPERVLEAEALSN